MIIMTGPGTSEDFRTNIYLHNKPHVSGFISVNLLGIGGQINLDEFVHLLKCPLAVSIGMLSRFAVMPAVRLSTMLYIIIFIF